MDSAYYLRRNEKAIADQTMRISSNTGLLNLRDNPIAASHAVRYASYLERLNTYEENAKAASDHYNEVDSYLRQENDVLQRVRELAVQGANGTYTADDTRAMGTELNELLKEMVSLANAQGSDGTMLFSGDKSYTTPFRVTEGSVNSDGKASPETEPFITAVRYQGAGDGRRTQVSDEAYLNLDLSGGDAFWAGKMEVRSRVDSSSYVAPSAQSFYIDGNKIDVAAGDSIETIVSKINASPAAVMASVDPDTRGLVLTGTNPHSINAQDAVGPDGKVGTVLQDLGLIGRNTTDGTTAWAAGTQVSGGSMFDAVINLRDAMLRGDTKYIGGQGLGDVDLAMDNLQARMALNGARQQRAGNVTERLNTAIPNMAQNLDNATGLDLAGAATDLAQMNTAQSAALEVASRMLPQSLLDFLQ
jgi:flagellar hook-associated protein 3 FlgL